MTQGHINTQDSQPFEDPKPATHAVPMIQDPSGIFHSQT